MVRNGCHAGELLRVDLVKINSCFFPICYVRRLANTLPRISLLTSLYSSHCSLLSPLFTYFVFSFAFCVANAFAAVSFEGLTFGAVGRLIPDTLLLTVERTDFFAFWRSLYFQLIIYSLPLMLPLTSPSPPLCPQEYLLHRFCSGYLLLLDDVLASRVEFHGTTFHCVLFHYFRLSCGLG